MVLEDIIALKDLGIGAVSMTVFFTFAKYVSEKSFTQTEEANKRAEEANIRTQQSQQKFIEFVDDTYKEHTKAIQELITEFKNHVKIKDEAIDLLKEQQESLKDELLIIKRFHKIEK